MIVIVREWSLRHFDFDSPVDFSLPCNFFRKNDLPSRFPNRSLSPFLLSYFGTKQWNGPGPYKGWMDKYQNIFSWYFFILKICPNNHFFARWCHQPVAVVVTTTIATFGWARVCDVRPALRPPQLVAFSSVLFHLSYQPHLANKRVIALP